MSDDLLTTDPPIDKLLQAGVLKLPTPPGQLPTLDRFEIVKVLGVGGRGVVLHALDTKSSDRVAIKVRRPKLLQDEHARRQFLEETRQMRCLDHPHILPVLEISESGDWPYFVMPLLELGSLAKRLPPGPPGSSAPCR